MPSKANNNGAAPLAQPPVRTLAVCESLRSRIEAAHKAVEADHPGDIMLQELLNVFVVCGLEAIEAGTDASGNQTTSSALGHLADPSTPRGLQKDAMTFLRWYMGPSNPKVPDGLGGVVMTFAPHLMEGDPDERYYAEAVKPDASARARAPQFWMRSNLPFQTVERIYDDSECGVRAASEQGRD